MPESEKLDTVLKLLDMLSVQVDTTHTTLQTHVAETRSDFAGLNRRVGNRETRFDHSDPRIANIEKNVAQIDATLRTILERRASVPALRQSVSRTLPARNTKPARLAGT